jgi:c-di-GMP-binding flagellar brake protein YcgR
MDKVRAERRKAVRMKPIPELPASAALLSEPPEPLTVSDVSAGGMALVTAGSLKGADVGKRLQLRLTMSRYGEHVIEVEVRYQILSGVTGVQFVDLQETAKRSIWRYVAELLERGAPS